MILGFDHIALNTNNLESSQHQLKSLGYRNVFLESNLPNSEHKKPLLKKYNTTHQAAFYTHPNGFNIESTCYGNGLENPPGRFNVELEDPKIIEINTNDVNLEYSFWKEGLKFKDTSIPNELIFQSPIKNWQCSLRLVEKPTLSKSSFLDSPGFTCLAFLCTNIEQELMALIKLGAKNVTDPLKMTINKKNITLAMLHSPTGAICELIQIQRK